MSKISSKRINRLLFVFVVSVALVGADLVVLAQNESNTQEEPTRGGQMTSNTQNGSMTGNTGTTGGRRRRRGRRRAGANANANANMSGDMSGNANMSTGDMSGNANMSVDTGNANMSGDMSANTGTGGRRRRRRRSAGAAATTDTTGATMTANVSGGEQTDLSGTYTGSVDYPEGGLTGDATLTITGNNFTLTAGSATQSGRMTAVTTRGYTGVTMMFGDLTPPAPGQAPPPLPAVSLRARRMGDRVTLMSVPGEKRRFSFSAGGMGGGGARRGRRGRRRSRGTMNMNGNMSGGGETTAPTTDNTNTPR